MIPTAPPSYGTILHSEFPQIPAHVGYNQGHVQGYQSSYMSGSPQANSGFQSSPGRYENFKSVQSTVLSIGQIIAGTSCIGLNSALIGIINARYPYDDAVVAYFGHGIWGGLLFTITGCLGVGAAKSKSKCLIVGFMVLCIISALVAAVAFSLSIAGCLESSYPDTLGRNIALVVLCVIEAVCSLWGSILCCVAACCCATSPVNYVAAGGQAVQARTVDGNQSMRSVSAPPINPQYDSHSGSPREVVYSVVTPKDRVALLDTSDEPY